MDRKSEINLIGISGKIGSGKDTFAKMIILAIHAQYANPFVNGEPFEDYWKYKLVDPRFPYSDTWKIKKFADKLKEIVCILIACTREQLEDQEFKNSFLPPMWDILELKWPGSSTKPIKWPAIESYISKFPDAKRRSITVREMMQLIGTDCMRDHLHSQVWVNALFSSWNINPLADSFNNPKWLITDVRFPNEVEAIKERGGIMIRMKTNIVNSDNFFWTDKGLIHRGSNVHESENALDTYTDWDYTVLNNGSLSDLYEQAKDLVKIHQLK